MYTDFTPEFTQAHEAALQHLKAWEHAMSHMLKARQEYELAKRAYTHKKAELYLSQDTGTVKDKELRATVGTEGWEGAMVKAQAAFREAEFVAELARLEYQLARELVSYYKNLTTVQE